MPFLPVLQSQEEKEAFAEIMAHPSRMDLSVNEISSKFGISIGTIYSKLKDPEIAALVKSKRAERVKIRLPEVDQAMIAKAIKGDVKAAELVYERWDDFVRRSGLELSKKPELSPSEISAREARVKEWLAKAAAGRPDTVNANANAISSGVHGASSDANAAPLLEVIPISTGLGTGGSMLEAGGTTSDQATPSTHTLPTSPSAAAQQNTIMDSQSNTLFSVKGSSNEREHRSDTSVLPTDDNGGNSNDLAHHPTGLQSSSSCSGYSIESASSGEPNLDSPKSDEGRKAGEAEMEGGSKAEG